MSGQEVVLVLGVVGTLITALAALYRTRGENRNKGQEVKQAIDAAIDARAKEELDRLYARVETLDKRVTTLEQERDAAKRERDAAEDARDLAEQREQDAIKFAERLRNVLLSWFSQMKAWDQGGRVGPWPIPPDEDMRLVDRRYQPEGAPNV